MMSVTKSSKRVGVRIDPIRQCFDAELGALIIIDYDLHLDVVATFSYRLVK